MRCVTRNEANTELDWVVSVSAVTYWRVFSGYVLLPMEMSNNLRVVIWYILLNIKKIWWAAKCRLCEKVGNLTFALSANLLWISTFLTLAMIHPTCLHLCTKLLSKARKGDAIHHEKSALFTIYWLSERKKNGIFRLSKSGLRLRIDAFSAVTYFCPLKCRTTCVSWFGVCYWVSGRYDGRPNAGYVKKWVTWLLLYLLTGCESALSSVVPISGWSVVW